MTVRLNSLRRRIAHVSGALLLAALLAGALIPAAAQENLDALRQQVQDWLLQELNKPNLVLTNYTFLGTSWPDDSLGCPTPEQTPTPGLVHGYEWTFEYDNQVRYTIHSDLQGTIKVLCSALNVGAEIRLVRYQALNFQILKPEAWLDFPANDGQSMLFASQSGDDCTLPGMRVVVLGQVASGVTPDELLTQHLDAAGGSDSPAARLPIGSFGRVTGFRTTCNGLPQQQYAAAFVEYGRAYRVEQWALVDDLPLWEQPFQNMVAQFAGAGTAPAAPGGSGSTSGGTAGAPSGLPRLTLPPLPLAHLFSDDVFVATLDDLPGRSITNLPLQDNHYLTFSPDGLHLAYVIVGEAQLRGLHAFEGRSARRLAEAIDPTFPPAWRADGQWVAYAAAVESDDPAVRSLEIRAVPAEGGTSELLATFAYAEGCDTPTASSDPADPILRREAAVSDSPQVLVWLAENRFLITSGCAGGLTYVDPAAGRVVELGPDMLGGALAPDRQRFAARTPDGIAILDFSAWQRSSLRLGTDVTALAWSADGSALYYASAELIDTVTLDDTGDARPGAELFGLWPVNAGVYDLHLRRVDPVAVTETEIWRGTGRGIGRITPAPDGSGLLFSVVPSAAEWAESFRSQYEPFAVLMKRPSPALYWLPTDSAVAYLIAYTGQPAFAPVAAPAVN